MTSHTYVKPEIKAWSAQELNSIQPMMSSGGGGSSSGISTDALVTRSLNGAGFYPFLMFQIRLDASYCVALTKSHAMGDCWEYEFLICGYGLGRYVNGLAVGRGLILNARMFVRLLEGSKGVSFWTSEEEAGQGSIPGKGDPINEDEETAELLISLFNIVVTAVNSFPLSIAISAADLVVKLVSYLSSRTDSAIERVRTWAYGSNTLSEVGQYFRIRVDVPFGETAKVEFRYVLQESEGSYRYYSPGYITCTLNAPSSGSSIYESKPNCSFAVGVN